MQDKVQCKKIHYLPASSLDNLEIKAAYTYPGTWKKITQSVFEHTTQVKSVHLLKTSPQKSSWSKSSWKKTQPNEAELVLAIQLHSYLPASSLRILLLQINRLLELKPGQRLGYTVVFSRTGSRTMRRLYPSSSTLDRALNETSNILDIKTKQRMAA